jgi:predicted benzoate:H+ symporter BenE
MVYDSGKNLMLAMGSGSIQFVSDASLPSVSPTSTVPEFSWLAILPLFLSIFSVVVVLRHQKPPT